MVKLFYKAKGEYNMSLIKCTECGKEFSDKAKCCPNCSCPTEDIINDTYKNSNTLCIDDLVYDVSDVVKLLANGDRDDAYAIAEEMIPHKVSGEITDILDCLTQGNFLQWSKDEFGYLRNQIIEQQISSKEQRIKSQATQNIPHCPNCNSTNIQKISMTSRAISGLTFGILSSNIGKTYQCNNCKYKW